MLIRILLALVVILSQLPNTSYARGEDYRRDSSASSVPTWMQQYMDSNMDRVPTQRQGIPSQKDLTQKTEVVNPLAYEIFTKVHMGYGEGSKKRGSASQGQGSTWASVMFDNKGVSTEKLNPIYGTDVIRIQAGMFENKNPTFKWSLTVDDGNTSPTIYKLTQEDPNSTSAQRLSLANASELGKPHTIVLSIEEAGGISKKLVFDNVSFIQDPCQTPVDILFNTGFGATVPVFAVTQTPKFSSTQPFVKGYVANVPLVIDGKYSWSFSIKGGKAPYKVSSLTDTLVGATGHDLNQLWQLVAGGNAVTQLANLGPNSEIMLKGGTFYTGPYTTPGSIQEKAQFVVTDSCPATNQSTVAFNFDVRYPHPGEQVVGDMQRADLKFVTEWTDGKSLLWTACLKDTKQPEKLCTGSLTVDGPDPSSFNASLVFNYCFVNYDIKTSCTFSSPITNITGFDILMADFGCCNDMVYKFEKVTLVGKYWYAINAIAQSGEVDGNGNHEIFAVPGNFKKNPDLDKVYPGNSLNSPNNIWFPRPNPGDPKEL